MDCGNRIQDGNRFIIYLNKVFHIKSGMENLQLYIFFLKTKSETPIGNYMSKSKIKSIALCSMLMLGFSSCSQKETITGNLNVIPLPQEVIEAQNGSSFIINSSTSISYPEDNEKMKRNAEFLASYIKKLTGVKVKLTTSETKNSIILKIDSSVEQNEGYELTVDTDNIVLKGSTEAGVFYGIQTIHKALPITDGKSQAAIPCGKVKDYPRFGFRGFMIDVGRHYFTTDYLKEIIDMLALHNINYFHWHLTEDQGWRIEIKKYPKLTEIGSKRKETITAPGSKEFDGKPVSGFYTQEEAKEIVEYAAERYITVIPEIDMPGHMLAALASYPELGCTGGPYEVATKFGVFDEVLCGGNEKTLQFAKDVVNEIMDIFPSPYIHIGGDECPKKFWKTCPKCQSKIKELRLKDTKQHTKENQLQAWFMGEVEKEIQARGRKMLAWDEILEGNPAKSTTVMAWTGPKARIKSVEQGHNTIACPISHLYFSNPGYNRLKGVSSVARVYNFEPVPEEVTEEQKGKLIGAQGCIWTEWTKDSVKMEWQMMPRIAALSEIQWTLPEKKNLDSFLKRLGHQIEIYGVYGYNYKKDIDDVNIEIKSKEDGTAEVSFSTFDNADVYYTIDNSKPCKTSLKYNEPFYIDKDCSIKAIAVRKSFTDTDETNDRISDVSEENIKYNSVTMRPITLNTSPAQNYTYKGKSILNDGLYGDGNYRSGRYLGFYGEDVDVTIDLQAEKEISSAFISTYLVPGDYIFGLKGIDIYTSMDGNNFNKVVSKDFPVLEKGSKNNVAKEYSVDFDKVKTRFVRIVGKSTAVLPKWHGGAGKTCFLFVDELGIR